MYRVAIIKKKGDQWCVYTKDGSDELGCHDTEQGAKDQLAAIEISKHSKAAEAWIESVGGKKKARALVDDPGFFTQCMEEPIGPGTEEFCAWLHHELTGIWPGEHRSSCRHLVMRLDASAKIRTATFDGREHLVVPVVAIKEGVLHAVNAETPELVLAEELEQCSAGFNGRPVVADHPKEGSDQVSANSPDILEREAFGTTFNARVDGKALKLEAWLDPVKASKNKRAAKVIDRIRNDEMVEVSVGVFVATEDRSGDFNGKEFSGVWRNIVPDHLAMLSEGIEGACSIHMGCGAPRAAQKKKEVLSMPEGEKEKTPCEKFRESSWERIKCRGAIRAAQEEAFSDIDLREALDAALRKVEPGFMGVDAVFPGENLVVFTVAPDETWKFMRRGFTVNDDGEVQLKGEAEEVKPVTRFEPVKAAESKEKKEAMDEKLKERLTALIQLENSPWEDSDLETLATFSADKIAAMEVAFAPKKEEPAPTTPVPNPVEDFEKEVGVSVAEAATIVKAAQKAEADKKESMVKKLTTAQDIYSEEELKAMDTPALEKLSRLAKVDEKADSGTVPDPPKIDFSGRGTPRSAQDESVVPDPPNIFHQVREDRAAK